MSKKGVRVVGAGTCGLACARQMLDCGFNVVLYERSAELGGLWVYHDDDFEGRASVMRTTIVNTSKEMSASSDFPPPKELPNYMHNTEMLGYFRSYADHFGVTKNVKTRHDVVQVTPAANYDKTGRWDMLVRDLETNTDRPETFDAVAVCVGHHVHPNVPYFKGQEKFRGRIVHTHSLKNADSFRDRRVAVVGIGNSGGDAVVDISHVALEAYGLKPKHRYNAQHPTTNDALPSLILSGIVRIKKNVAQFTEDGATPLDDVTLATGYQIKFPFLPKEVVSVVENQVQLYKYVFPPQLRHPSLAIIGLVQPVGGMFPVAEM
ncbi:hypothetical protein HPB52_005546 [Rhipicephalus sanguineus]|uniref:Flavin-containing monooxygenase n=1 Tax=Rhipicephalus sanguineus TaxID=34632 RepID=A0A9D4Q4T8_RHISA|nr:hypothetical protein HPB52_005546 [Rhipicephalus sanguineus]